MANKKPAAKREGRSPREPYKEGGQWYLDVAQANTYINRENATAPLRRGEARDLPRKKTPISERQAQSILTDIRNEVRPGEGFDAYLKRTGGKEAYLKRIGEGGSKTPANAGKRGKR